MSPTLDQSHSILIQQIKINKNIADGEDFIVNNGVEFRSILNL
jgi:hypothetical protein